MTILDDIVTRGRVAIGARPDLDIDDNGLPNGAWAHATFAETLN